MKSVFNGFKTRIGQSVTEKHGGYGTAGIDNRSVNPASAKTKNYLAKIKQ
jgi:hypothetical protein